MSRPRSPAATGSGDSSARAGGSASISRPTPIGGAEVALALYDTEGVGAGIQARARREAEAMRKLGDHPHVVPVFDTGEDDGNPFIVSRYMPGGDVEGLLRAAGGHLEVSRARRDRR